MMLSGERLVDLNGDKTQLRLTYVASKDIIRAGRTFQPPPRQENRTRLASETRGQGPNRWKRNDFPELRQLERRLLFNGFFRHSRPHDRANAVPELSMIRSPA